MKVITQDGTEYCDFNKDMQINHTADFWILVFDHVNYAFVGQYHSAERAKEIIAELKLAVTKQDLYSMPKD